MIYLNNLLWSVTLTAHTSMKLVPYQTCRSTEGWYPVRVPSKTKDGKYYTVLVSPWAVQESICECYGYIYRGRCTHQDRAAEKVCGWSELTNPQQQNDDERKHKVCPLCGGPTKWEVEVIDEG